MGCIHVVVCSYSPRVVYACVSNISCESNSSTFMTAMNGGRSCCHDFLNDISQSKNIH